MPTGYTYKIKDGISFKEYAMICARAFGATIAMRDDSMDDSIPEKFEASTYNKDNIFRYEKELKELMNMSIDVANQEAEKEYQKALKSKERLLEENNDLKEKYERMLSCAMKWQYPSPEHKQFKDFMVSQIEDSIEADCGDSYLIRDVKKLTGEEWLKLEIERVKRSIEYHSKEWLKEVERTDGRNLWIKQLRNSLINMSFVDNEEYMV